MGTFNTKRGFSESSEFISTLRLSLEETKSTENASETPQVLTLLASVLEKTIQKNEKFLKRSRTKDGVTIFHGSRAPSLSVRQYIERVHKYAKCSLSCFVVAYIYMDRFTQGTNSYLTSLNVHRLLITCVLVAAKFLDDASLNNSYYAKIGGLSLAELNKLELKLLFDLDFRLHVTLHSFDQYCMHLDKEGTRTSGSCHIERVIQVCGLKQGSKNKHEPKCTSKFVAYTCRAI